MLLLRFIAHILQRLVSTGTVSMPGIKTAQVHETYTCLSKESTCLRCSLSLSLIASSLEILQYAVMGDVSPGIWPGQDLLLLLLLLHVHCFLCMFTLDEGITSPNMLAALLEGETIDG